MIRTLITIFLLFNTSSSFNMNNHIYYIPIDNTICYTNSDNYLHSIPDYKRINKINKLYKNGCKINYWCNRNEITGKNWSYFTERQLKIWGVYYSEILMYTPSHNYDKNIDFDNII